MAVALIDPSSLACTALQSRRPAAAAGIVERPRCSSSASIHTCLPGSLSVFGQRVCSSARTSFAGDRHHLRAAVWSVPHGAASGSRPMIVMAKPVIQFIRGINEQSIADVKLTRSRDGSNGVANFVFDQPSVFDSSRELGDITGLYMIDDEGVISSVDVSAKFVNGKPAKIEARYVMRNLKEWDRFMRFMERYANENELGFVKS